MKNLISALSVAIMVIAAPSCKREMPIQNQEHEKDAYRVLGIGKAPGDTSISTSMWARTETVGLIMTEDSKLRAELIGYQKINGKGVYTVALTNKQACDIIPKWGWELLNIDSITPSTGIIPANGYQVYTLIGDAKEGKIKVQAEGQNCGNSSTLIVNITTAVLPITYLNNTATYDQHSGKTTIQFSIDRPDTINWYIIQKLQAGNWVQVAMIPGDDQIKQYKFTL